METLMVATHGGHISELLGLRDRIDDLGQPLWVTSDHAQTRATLEHEVVKFVPLIESRDVLGVLRAAPQAFRLLRRRRFARVVSTGSAIALAYLPVAAMLRVPAHYIESSTRIMKPSVTGRVLATIPGVTTWWQHDDPPKGWKRVKSLYAHFSAEPRPLHEITSVVVTVGTTDYCFRRLIERLVEIIPEGVDVFWQVGTTDTSGLGIDAVTVVSSDELMTRIAGADVVVSHAGAGSLLQCLEGGKVPVYVPRLGSRGEQIDDHQIELAEWAGRTGLALTVDASTVTWQDLLDASHQRAVAGEPQRIKLDQR